MFKKARVKLTLLYVGLLVALTSSFSLAVYIRTTHAAKLAIEHHNNMIERRLERITRPDLPPRFQYQFAEESLNEVKTEILYTLAVINLSIWTIFGSLAYWFAGKTLQPIEEMTQKQKQFIADAAHELKTPLTAIKTNLEVNLRAKNITKEQSLEVIKDTIQDVDTLTELTKNLLIQSKYETTKALKLEKVDLKTTVQKILKQNKARIANKKINLVTELTSTNILATNASVKELITILLDNAIKFTNTEGDIYLSIKTQQAHVEFTVANTGEQINSQDLEHIFDRFYKAKKSRTNSKEEGYGIGLAVAKEITQKINSIINVSSNPELTTFTITFPKA